jgi:hypothetical protein
MSSLCKYSYAVSVLNTALFWEKLLQAICVLDLLYLALVVWFIKTLACFEAQMEIFHY